MPWKASLVMEERLRFGGRLLDGEPMSDVFREFGREHGLFALTDRSRRPVRYANQLPQQVESLIVNLKRDKPHWGARKIRELPVSRSRLHHVGSCPFGHVKPKTLVAAFRRIPCNINKGSCYPLAAQC
jgi:hypothetical protein